MSKSYLEKLKDPRWQKRRLEILDRDGWKCKVCGEYEETLHVHHVFYLPKIDPWDHPRGSLLTLCKACHFNECGDKAGDSPVDIIFEQLDIFLSTLWEKGYSPDDLITIAFAFSRNPILENQTLENVKIKARIREK